MLQASLLTTGAIRTTADTPTTPPPAPAPTTTIKTLFTTQPTRLQTVTKTPMTVVAAPYTCSNNVCTATGQLGFTFQTLQSLMNMANKKLGNAAIAVDGKIDTRTLNAYLPITRAVGGTLAVFDFTPTVDWLAKNADTFARALALWLGMTWVEATGDVPGHWERIRAGQTTVNLPTMPTAPPPQPGGMVVMQPEQPTQPTTPTQPPPVMVMYVCPDGTRVSDMSACPKPATTPTPTPATPTCPSGTAWSPSTNKCEVYYVAPTPPPSTTPPPGGYVTPAPQPSALPVPGATPTSGRYSGCLARFNRTRKVYAIYCPVGSTGAQPGLGTTDQEYFRCLRGNCTGLGADTVTPPPPSGFVKAAEVTTLPGAGEQSAGEERDKFWRIGNPLMWAAIAGAATVVGGGSYALYRRKHRSA